MRNFAEENWLSAVASLRMLEGDRQRKADVFESEQTRLAGLRELLANMGDEGLDESDPVAAAEVGSARLRRKIDEAPARISAAEDALLEVELKILGATADADELHALYLVAIDQGSEAP